MQRNLLGSANLKLGSVLSWLLTQSIILKGNSSWSWMASTLSDFQPINGWSACFLLRDSLVFLPSAGFFFRFLADPACGQIFLEVMLGLWVDFKWGQNINQAFGLSKPKYLPLDILSGSKKLDVVHSYICLIFFFLTQEKRMNPCKYRKTAHISRKNAHTNRKRAHTNGKKAHTSEKKWYTRGSNLSTQVRTAANYQWGNWPFSYTWLIGDWIFFIFYF